MNRIVKLIVSDDKDGPWAYEDKDGPNFNSN